MGYDFQARIPIDHVMQLVRNIRSGDYERGDNLQLAAAALGEVGALLKSGLVVSLDAEDVPATLDGCCRAIEQFAAENVEATAIPPWLIPIIMKLIELLLAGKRA